MKCNKCSKQVDEEDTDDILDAQEWLRYRDIGGYGALIGDMTKWSVILCQECTQEVLGEYIEIEE